MPRDKWPDEKMRLWVTLYADAGWKDGRTRVGFIARNSRAPCWLNGNGEANVDNSEAGEALAVLFGLRRILETWTPVEGVFLRIDCKNLANKLEFNPLDPFFKRFDKYAGDTGKILRGVRDLCAVSGPKVGDVQRRLHLNVRHVRAHGREPDQVRRWMNEQADILGNMRNVS